VFSQLSYPYLVQLQLLLVLAHFLFYFLYISDDMAPHTRPEPMNASPHHSKVKLTLTQADRIFVAGTHITGKLEMECRADQGLGIGVMMVELFAIQGTFSFCDPEDSTDVKLGV
jgi:hypothetical protein